MGNGSAKNWLLLYMFLGEPKRAKHFAAMVLIGDGIMALVHPRQDAKAWKKGPWLWCKLMGALAERPVLTRVIGAAQVIGGIWWVLHEEEKD